MRFRNYWSVGAGIIVGVLMLSTGLAAAQAIGVLDRARPAYDPKGIPLGGFRLYPQLNVDTAFDDNVFRLPNGQSDWYVRESPVVRVQSEWEQHFVEIFGGVDNYNYGRFSSLDLTDWNVGGAGRYDIMRGAAIAVNGTYGEYHEPLYSPNTVGNQISPSKFHKGHAEISGSYQPNRIGVSGGFTFDRLTYDSASLLGGGLLDNVDRNENEYQAYIRSFYDFSPGYTGFVKVTYDSRAFDQYFDRSGFHRSSIVFNIACGVDLEISNLIYGEVFAGYLEQHYAQNLPNPLNNIAGLDFGGKLNWYPTELLTVHLSADHLVSDVILSGVSASLDDAAKLSAECELGYNVIAQAYGGYTHSRLQGSSRSDDYPSAGVNVRYLMNEYLSANVSYDYGERSSTIPTADYRDNMISLRLTGHV